MSNAELVDRCGRTSTLFLKHSAGYQRVGVRRESSNGGQHDEVIAADRRYVAEGSVAVLLEADREVSSLPAAPRT